MRISDWSSDVCSSDLERTQVLLHRPDRVHPVVDKKHLTAAFDLAQDRLADQARAVGTEIGRASCRDRVCQYVSLSVVAVSLKKNRAHIHEHRSNLQQYHANNTY